MKRILTTITCGLLMTTSIYAQETFLKRKVAIGRFSNETQYAKSIFYDKNNDPMGKQASDILAAKLAGTEKFIFIERQDFDKIIQEYNDSSQINQRLGADYLIIGSITEYGRKNIGTQNFGSRSKEQIVEAGVSIRLVDVSTGLVIFSGEAKGEATAKDKTVLGFGKSADFDATLSDKAITAAINKLVEGIINKCTDSPWKSYLLAFEEGNYIISGGKSQGIKEGDTFAVFSKGRKVKNPQTGAYIELPGKEIGKVKVVTMIGNTPLDEVSIVELINGEIDNTAFDKYFITETSKN